MRAGFLVALVAAAVVVPTAVIRPAPGHGFSVQQVMRVFAAAGVPLQRQPGDYLSGSSAERLEERTVGQGVGLNVTVYRPGSSPPRYMLRFVALGDVIRSAHRGNVYVLGTFPGTGGVRSWHVVLDALRQLRFSPADAALPQLPTFELGPGERRALTEQEAPNGSEVDCTNGSVRVRNGRVPLPVVAPVVIQAATRRSGALSSATLEGRDGRTRSTTLRWRPLHGGTVLEFACSAKAPAGFSGVSPPLPPPSASQTVVHEGFGTIDALPPTETGPLPPLKLARSTNTLGNEYADVSAKTRRAMLGAR